MPASSVAVKSEVRTVPLASNGRTARGASTSEATRLPSMRSTRSRVNWVGSFSVLGAPYRPISSSSLPLASVRTCTRLPARPSSSLRATGSVRRKVAAAASLTPRRANRESALSPAR